MNTLYLLLDLGVIIFPFLLSFDKKVHYVGDWGATFGALFAIGVPFLIHDYFFTEMGVWGFNPDYLTGYYLLNLPIEEVLFFVVVPYACTFVYACCGAYFTKIDFKTFNLVFYVGMLLYAIVILVLGMGRWYSTMVAIIAFFLGGYLWVKRNNYPYLPIAVLLSMIPFFIMNSILTGSFTPAPIVWYDNAQNIGYRWGTIPAEDILYSFLLVAGNILVFKFLVERKRKITTTLQKA
ncbi:lycopene cyclase domain-containing protein [Aureispira sp. CCB-QB1]|uniref:lycopene cyclase domain-containing protein n=1 Tax=Aureispira sp. CCB-QB1 TaxID=1313421 RepID=UPI00069601CE|nr:lycopene cyclase domain-containing protein [Aureispira sp. CCB-QB1]